MPTKEEILKKHFSNNSGTPWSEIHASMEEYAKQEALGYYNWLSNSGILILSSVTDDFLWNAYQSHKAAEALKTAAANQPN